MRARLRHASWGKIGLATIVVLYIVWSLAPVLIAFLFSFNAGYSRSTWQGFRRSGGQGQSRCSTCRSTPMQSSTACFWPSSRWSLPSRWVYPSRSS